MRKYYQHMLDILINDGIEYEDIARAYGDETKSESIKRSHRDKNRGNLPRKTSPGTFFDSVIDYFYYTIEKKKNFADSLLYTLNEYEIFPAKWVARKNMISGSSPDFNATMFRNFVIDLLEIDKVNKNPTYDPVKPKKIGDMVSAKDTPISFSEKFFSAGAKNLVNASKEQVMEEISKLSLLYGKIANVCIHDDDSFVCEGNWLKKIFDMVSAELNSNKSAEILKVEGPLGAYKNRLMQYLYLAIAKSNPDVIPFYIDILSYEKMAETDASIDESAFLEEFKKDIAEMEKLYVENRHKTPLLILDGVHDFFCRNKTLYYSMNQLIKNLKFKKIVCVNTDFTVNKCQQYTDNPIVSNNYSIYLRLRSMNLERRGESIEFIKNSIEIFGIEIPEKITAEIIYNSLLHLGFLTIDAFWLVYILTKHLDEVVGNKADINKLYFSVCINYLQDGELMDEAANIAYEFEFGQMEDCNETNPYFDLRWRLIRMHRSVLEYLIARYCAKELGKLNLKGNNLKQNEKSMLIFSIVFPKSITRFLAKMLSGDDKVEHQFMIIAEHYDELSINSKSQLIFWLGRLTNPSRRAKAKTLLQKFFQKEKEAYSLNNFDNITEKRDAAFLLRGICVSLILESDKDAFVYYMNSLLTDEISASVNKGFHLEYYGDKPLSTHTFLDYEDDITKGEITLTTLCVSLDKKRKKQNTNYVAILEVMTLCSLIQARMEYHEGVVPLDVTPYTEKVKNYIQWIITSAGVVQELPDVCSYLKWMHDVFSKQKSVHYPSDVMNTLVEVSYVGRTGWKKYEKLSRIESIAEHMFGCVVIGMFYLPNEYDKDTSYCKDSIIKMLLIHDLAETVTGDIPRPVKEQNKEHYKEMETAAMQEILFSGSYSSAVGMDEYLQLWKMWSAKNDINSRVAKDIDNIQTIYKFCDYYTRNPGLFTQDDVKYWLADMNIIVTDIGKEIVEKIILNNPKFYDVVHLITE